MLYTVLMEYRGGMYISQVDGNSVTSALQRWAAGLDPAPIQGLGQARKRELVNQIDFDIANGMGPTPLDGLKNVWFTSASTSGGPSFINIVATQPRQKRPQRSRIIEDPVTGLPVLSAGPGAPVLTSKEVQEILDREYRPTPVR